MCVRVCVCGSPVVQAGSAKSTNDPCKLDTKFRKLVRTIPLGGLHSSDLQRCMRLSTSGHGDVWNNIGNQHLNCQLPRQPLLETGTKLLRPRRTWDSQIHMYCRWKAYLLIMGRKVGWRLLKRSKRSDHAGFNSDCVHLFGQYAFHRSRNLMVWKSTPNDRQSNREPEETTKHGIWKLWSLQHAPVKGQIAEFYLPLLQGDDWKFMASHMPHTKDQPTLGTRKSKVSSKIKNIWSNLKASHVHVTATCALQGGGMPFPDPSEHILWVEGMYELLNCLRRKERKEWPCHQEVIWIPAEFQVHSPRHCA